MPIEWPTVIEGGIPILGGLYATALGYGAIGASPSPPSALRQRLLARFKWLGPAVVLFGVFTAWQTHLHVIHPPAEEIVRQMTARMSFPAKVDDLTQTVGVEGKGDVIIYHYSVAASLADLGGREGCNTDSSNSCGVPFARPKTRARFFKRAIRFRPTICSKDILKRFWFPLLHNPARSNRRPTYRQGHHSQGPLTAVQCTVS
jgi:hypothetical protein